MNPTAGMGWTGSEIRRIDNPLEAKDEYGKMD